MSRRLPLIVPPDADGPRVRLGLAWFAVSVGAAAASPVLLAVVMGAAAGLAADQITRLHHPAAGSAGSLRQLPQRLLADPARLPAALAGAALPVAALGGADTLGAAAAAATVVLIVHRLLTPAAGPAVVHLALALPGALVFGIAGAVPVLVAGLGTAAVLLLLVLVAAYEAGDFLVGTGAAARWEGPAAGVLAVAVCGFGGWVLALPPLGASGSATLAAVVALLAPFGPPAASVLVGDAVTPARFVRRLDTLVVLGPVAAWAAAAMATATP